MTWSIIARDPHTGALGLAVTTKFFAVGALCAYGAGRVGAVATQAFVNPLFGLDGLKLLAEGRSPEEILPILLRDDPGASVRQLHILAPDGRTARHTGADCVDWCGHVSGEHVSVAGNMLAGPRVVEATLETYLAGMDLPFPDRLIAALDAGQAEGGDKRGKQSAALKIWRDEPFPVLDIRVDDHPEPLAELRRLHEVAYERFAAFMEALPTRTAPGGNTDRSWVDRRAAEMVAERRALAARSNG
jgi:uncharacterized Ntn-hydrolase superfamily protein